MPLTERTFMGSVPHDCNSAAGCFGTAVAALLRQRHPFHTAKSVAADLSRAGLGQCTVRTAENLLAGHLSAKSITRLTVAYGLGFLIEAGAVVSGETLEEFIETQARRARHEQTRWDHLQAVLEDERAARASQPSGLLGRRPERPVLPMRRDTRRLG